MVTAGGSEGLSALTGSEAITGSAGWSGVESATGSVGKKI